MKQIIKNTTTACYITCLFIITATITGCKKYLEAKSNTSLVVPSTLKDLQALLDYNNMMNLQTPTFGETSADDYFLPPDSYNAMTVDEQSKYTWSTLNYNIANDWSYGYSAIYPANICLERVDKIPLTSQNRLQWNNVKGSALFFRAYWFQQLAVIYAKAYDQDSFNTDLGIVLRTSSDINVPSVRSSVKQTYDKIIEDTKEAATLLPDNPQHPMRPSKAAAYGLLARTFLCMRLYDSAGKYAQLALQIKNTLLNYNDPATVNINSSLPFTPFNAEVIFHTQMNSWCNHFKPAEGGKVDTVLYASYDNNDLRKVAFFEATGMYQQFKGDYAGTSSNYFSGIATDELLLISAESKARSGNALPALDDLNTLLAKRYLTATFVPAATNDPAIALQIILKERRKELLMRGLRWSDIKRLNKEASPFNLVRIVNGQTIILQPNDKRYALPLPIDIIENSSLEQN